MLNFRVHFHLFVSLFFSFQHSHPFSLLYGLFLWWRMMGVPTSDRDLTRGWVAVFFFCSSHTSAAVLTCVFARLTAGCNAHSSFHCGVHSGSPPLEVLLTHNLVSVHQRQHNLLQCLGVWVESGPGLGLKFARSMLSPLMIPWVPWPLVSLKLFCYW